MHSAGERRVTVEEWPGNHTAGGNATRPSSGSELLSIPVIA